MTQTQVFQSAERPTPEQMDPIENTTLGGERDGLLVKPHGGLWTSTLTPDGSSAWLKWCDAEDYHPDGDGVTAWLLDPTDDAQTFVIDSFEDFEWLLGEFGRDDIADDFRVLGEGALDFERFFAETAYVGLTLTDRGQAETRFSRPGLYGWDCESTIWSAWVFENVRFSDGVCIDRPEAEL